MDDKSPDFHIETFWLDFKKSMINFYENNKINRPINIWSDNLNKLQEEKKYDKIQQNIRDYISLFAIDLLRNNDSYHLGILITNIKRWNKLSLQYNFFTNNGPKYYNIIFLLIDLYENILSFDKRECDEILNQIELFVLYNDITLLIKYAIKFNKGGMLDKIKSYTNLNEKIKEIYNIELPNNISGKKLLKYFN